MATRPRFWKGLVEAGVESVAFHAICDPEAVAAGMKSGIGPAALTLGGKIDPALGGGPLTLSGEITHLSDGRFVAYGPMGGGVERNYGPSLVFHVGGIDIILITNNGQGDRPRPVPPRSASTRRGTGPSRSNRCSIFRAAFEPIAREVILVHTGALCQVDYDAGKLQARAPADLADRRHRAMME